MDLVLGLSVESHDTSYAVGDLTGNVYVHAELERDIRIKQAGDCPLLYFLSSNSFEKYINDIRSLTLALSPYNLKLYNQIKRILNSKELLNSVDESSVLEVVRSARLSSKHIGALVSEECFVDRLHSLLSRLKDVAIFGHHFCHAAEAWGTFNSDRDTCSLIFTLDGGGWDIDISKGEAREVHASSCFILNGKEIWRSYDWNLSLGGIYIEITKALGFTIGPPEGSQEGSVMGLAAYGDPGIYMSLFKNKFLWQNTSVSNPDRNDVLKARSNLIQVIQECEHKPDWDLHKRNFAASLQKSFEQQLDKYILKNVFEVTKNIDIQLLKSKKISILLSGGCSLNCAAVGKLSANIKSYLPDHETSVFVSLAPYDGGLSLGSYFAYLSQNSSLNRHSHLSPYLGPSYSKITILNALNGSKLNTRRLEIDVLCNALDKGQILAIYQGKSESGRRALCNRSIIADPRNPRIRDIVNKKVKHRPLFRPFAPVILKEYVNEWFEIDQESPYMSHAIRFRSEKTDLVPSVVHKDQTGRLQTLSQEENTWMHKLLVRWHRFSGCPILINTSFNDNEPIVESPYNAISCFLRTNIDILLFPELDILVQRSDQL